MREVIVADNRARKMVRQVTGSSWRSQKRCRPPPPLLYGKKWPPAKNQLSAAGDIRNFEKFHCTAMKMPTKPIARKRARIESRTNFERNHRPDGARVSSTVAGPPVRARFRNQPTSR